MTHFSQKNINLKQKSEIELPNIDFEEETRGEKCEACVAQCSHFSPRVSSSKSTLGNSISLFCFKFMFFLRKVCHEESSDGNLML